ncbi:MAG: TIR domain-containing protein [Saprospiraceae bacterium]
MQRNRVFISYSWNDKEKVIPIVNSLQENGIEIFMDSINLEVGQDLKNSIRYNIEGSETIIVFFSKEFTKSKWAEFELSTALNELKKRNINIVPVTLDSFPIPEKLRKYQVINLSKPTKGIDKLVQRLIRYKEVTFDDFDYQKFENLIFDFLKEYKFLNIERTSQTRDSGYDFKAEFKSKSPFGKIINEHWIIEVKFYKKERFSISSIQQLLSYKRQLLPADLKLLLITNSQLTSVAQEFLKEYQKIENTQVEVIDGQFLKNLISNRKRLLDKYFKQ